MPSSPIIDVANLSVERDRPILSNISWRVAPGENWVILGPNGSGKTCLLRSLAGYIAPTRGEVLVCGNAADEPWDEIRKHIGFVSSNLGQRIEDDEPALETVISGRYAMINYWAPHIKRADRQRAKEMLAWVECAHLENHPWQILSQGERQRILIARALMTDDLQLLILDEPCAGLDPVARESFLEFLERFARPNRTAKARTRTSQRGGKNPPPALLFVTHHVEEIIEPFTHVLILNRGRAVAAGPIAKTLNSSTLSRAFEADCTLRRRNHRYALTVRPGSKGFRT